MALWTQCERGSVVWFYHVWLVNPCVCVKVQPQVLSGPSCANLISVLVTNLLNEYHALQPELTNQSAELSKTSSLLNAVSTTQFSLIHDKIHWSRHLTGFVKTVCVCRIFELWCWCYQYTPLSSWTLLSAPPYRSCSINAQLAYSIDLHTLWRPKPKVHTHTNCTHTSWRSGWSTMNAWNETLDNTNISKLN